MNDFRKIAVSEQDGIYRVSAEFQDGFHLIPSPKGNLSLAFWDEKRMIAFLENFGFYPEVSRRSN